ncbi:unnamed protein product [Notodromas monacha]|uniref:RBR-type E3 ubiquitin transferase n=1 Tax=Notodromas monacha TaxID=399045 RepID=A0A7R9G9G8_9CRUS|nr:unnamed protein product [Notodromas monacha]CAG0914197.1 unnamed protein product [Notodromas monacha]
MINKYRGYFALFGGFMIHLTLGTIYSFGNLTTYITSYIRQRNDPTFTYEHATWIYTGAVMTQGFLMFAGGQLEKKIGARWTAFCGCLLFSGGVFSTAFAIEVGFWLVVISYGVLFGAGVAFAYIVPLSCGMKWFPESKGLANGVILGGFGLGAFVFSYLQTWFINPENLSVATSGYFENDEILDRVPQLFMILGGVYFVLQLIGLIFLCPPQTRDIYARLPSIDEEKRGILDDDNSPNRRRSSVLPIGRQAFNDFSGSGVVDIVGNDLSLSPGSALKTKEFYMLWFTLFFNQQAIGFISTMYKAYGQTFIKDDQFLALVGGIASIFNSLGRVMWGYLADRTSYRRAMLLMSGLLAGWFFSFIATPRGGKYMFALWVCLIFMTFCGNFSLLPTATSQTFGPMHAASIYGLVFSGSLNKGPQCISGSPGGGSTKIRVAATDQGRPISAVFMGDQTLWYTFKLDATHFHAAPPEGYSLPLHPSTPKMIFPAAGSILSTGEIQGTNVLHIIFRISSWRRGPYGGLFLVGRTRRENAPNSLGPCDSPPRNPTTDPSQPGECIPISGCPELVKNLRSPNRDIGYLRRTICRLIDGKPYVCCPTTSGTPVPSVEPMSSVNFTTSPGNADRRLFPNPRNYECGGTLITKITNGENAARGAWPWMALLFYKGVKGSGTKHGCGGSLINKRYVMTAAHCILESDIATLAFVRLGEHDLRTNPDCDRFNQCTYYRDIPVESVKVHPDFIQHPYKGAKNDIALVRLTSDAGVAEDGLKIAPVCLPFDPFDVDAKGDPALSSAQTTLLVTGWGKISVQFENEGSDILQQLQVPIVSAEKCRETPAFRRVDFGPGHLCAGGVQGKDSCKGDSGGPLMITGNKTEISTVFFQVGIVSFGTPYCGLIRAPGVYTRVSEYLEWIMGHACGDSDKSEQDDEVLALVNIFERSDEYKISANEEKLEDGTYWTGCIEVSPLLPSIFRVVIDSNSEPAAKECVKQCIEYLPHFCLYFTFPHEYPSKSPPKFTLTCEWLTRNCLKSYFEVQINENRCHSLTCPESKCDTPALPSQVREIVGDELFKKYDSLLLASSLDKMEDVCYCPRNFCQAAVILDAPDELGTAEVGRCPQCFFVFCNRCRRTYHGVEPCNLLNEEKRKLYEAYVNGTQEVKRHLEKKYGLKQIQSVVAELDSESWLDENSKRCPRCNARIEKSGGCNKMACWKCGSFFCWLCSALLPKDNPYAHFSRENVPCFNQLFAGTRDRDDHDDFEFFFREDLDVDDEDILLHPI